MKFQEFWRRFNPKTQNLLLFLRDVLFFIIKYVVFVYLVFSPIFVPFYLLKTFSPSTIAALNKLTFPQNLFLLIPFAIYMWCAVSFLIAEMGGWRKFARRFPAPPHFAESQRFEMEGQWFNRQSGAFGIVGYNNILNIRVCPQGLYLACMFLFRIGHPPLLIPWSEVNVIQRQVLWGKSTYLKIGSPKLVTITLGNKKLIEAITSYSPQGL